MMKSKAIRISALVVIALFSILVLRPLFTPNALYKDIIVKLDEKRDTAATLSAVIGGMSVLISAIPDDCATPIAEKVADISAAFVIVLVVIFIEKYALALLGSGVTLFLIPAICGLRAVWIMENRKAWFNKEIFIKLIVLALASLFIIPVGVLAGDAVESTFSASIEKVVSTTMNGSEEFKGIITDNRNIFRKWEMTLAIFLQIYLEAQVGSLIQQQTR